MTHLAFIDCETTGLNPSRHELIEIAVLRVDAHTLDVVGEIELRIAPQRVEDAEPDAMAVNGYSPEAWSSAVSLDDALRLVGPLLEGATLAGQNVAFDRKFLDAAWTQTGVTPPTLDYHVLDTVSLAWPLLSAGLIEGLSLNKVCAHLGIARPSPHRAIGDARVALEVARRLLPTTGIAIRAAALEGDEQAILETLLARIDNGRGTYGPWRVNDGREYPREALHEVFDAPNYVAAELVRLDRMRSLPEGGE